MARSDVRVWLALAVAVASAVVVSCAAIGGLGDFTEVDCVGAACADGGTSGGDASDDGTATPEGGSAAFSTIGGSVSGLKGAGLVLKNNGADDLQVSADGPFSFPAAIRNGEPYAVTVGSQPSNPTQTCTVTNGSGTAAGADVTNVQITCATAAYAVGGTVVGLTGAGLVLTNNGGDDRAVSASGPFAFATKVASGATYAVAVKTQPSSGGPCAVSGGTGTVGVGDVTGVVVNCAPGTYTVGGTVSNLNGTVVVQLNGGNNLSLNANGSFAFPATLAPSAGYAVTVLTQPGYPPRSQTCTVSGGTGTMGSANVTSVSISCATNAFTVGGSVTGLTGTLVLRNNGGDNLTVNAAGPFTFATPIQSGSTYAVTVGTQPSGQTCTVAAGSASGTVTSANVTNVAVSCGGGSTNQGILCGAAYCDPASAVCCLSGGNYSCVTKCTGGGTTQIACDDARDCGGALICCGSVSGTTLNSVYCTQPSLCLQPKAFFCNPAEATPCPNGGTCTPTSNPPGYYRCY